ncbi:MAG: alpha/beta hydrolase [Gammaproteobacteria bacterium]|jgi:hypothetical protein
MVKGRFILGCLSILLLTACNGLQSRLEQAEIISTNNNFEKKTIETTHFNLATYQRINSTSKSAVIYIEGDGFSWKNKYTVSNNPTPKNPVALKLAAIDTSPIVIYIARPCQFINIKNETNCKPEYWTSKRASKEVIESFSAAIDSIKKELNINQLRLVGFSGGATIATILAANRNDVIDLRTIAGNLDIDKFVEVHNVSPLTSSINPTDYADKLVKIPQTHVISMNDSIITADITDSYLKYLEKFDTNLKCVEVIKLSKPEHTKGWADYWSVQSFSKVQSCIN